MSRLFVRHNCAKCKINARNAFTTGYIISCLYSFWNFPDDKGDVFLYLRKPHLQLGGWTFASLGILGVWGLRRTFALWGFSIFFFLIFGVSHSLILFHIYKHRKTYSKIPPPTDMRLPGPLRTCVAILRIPIGKVGAKRRKFFTCVKRLRIPIGKVGTKRRKIFRTCVKRLRIPIGKVGTKRQKFFRTCVKRLRISIGKVGTKRRKCFRTCVNSV